MKRVFCVICLLFVLLAGEGKAGTVIIPSAVREIDVESFYGDKKLDEVVLPEGLTIIRERAFADTGLKQIYLPRSLRWIADDAFDLGVKIKANEGTDAYEWAVEHGFISESEEADQAEEEDSTFTFADNADGRTCTVTGVKEGVFVWSGLNIPQYSPSGKLVTRIGDYAFAAEESINENGSTVYIEKARGMLSLPDSIEYIGDYAFLRCYSLTGSLTIPDSVISIGESAFESCSGFTGQLVAGNKVETIGNRAFYGCSGFTGIIFGDCINNIGERAFSFCSGLTGTIMIPGNVDTIGACVFENCFQITQIICGGGVNSIAESAFAFCFGLETIQFSEGTTALSKYMLQRCSKLTMVYLPSTIQSIDKEVFGDRTALPVIYGGNAYVKQWCAENYVSYNGESVEYTPCILDVDARLAHYYLNGIEKYTMHVFGRCAYAAYPIDISQGQKNLKFYFSPDNNRENAVLITANTTGCGCAGNTYEFRYTFWLSETNSNLVDGTGGYLWMEVDNGIGSDSYSVKVDVIDYESEAEAGIIYIPNDDATCKLEFKYLGSGLTGTFYVPAVDEVSGRRVTDVSLYDQSITTLVIPEGVETLEISGLSNLETMILPRSLSMTYYGSLIRNCDNLKNIYLYPENKLWTYLENNGYADKLISRNREDSVEDLINSEGSDADQAQVTSVTIAQDTISAGTNLEFTVEAANAWKVQLIVDNEYYDEYWLEDNCIHAFRKITMAGDRNVAFRAYGPEGWGRPSEATTVHVTSEGTLNVPSAVWKKSIYIGDPETLRWTEVENADGYRIYLNHPNGAIDSIEPQETDNFVKDETGYSYTFPAETFDAAGTWSVRLMAYGKGYGQSSTLCTFSVSDQYRTWTGWAQKETIPAYDTVNATSANGHYVDYIDPVTVKGETDNGRYLVTYQLTSGGNATRYVEKDDIGTEPFSPVVTLSGTYFFQDGKLYISAVTNLAATKAGLRDAEGKPIGNTAYEPSRMVSTYRKAYYFSLPVPKVQTSYIVWASDGKTEKTKRLTVDPPVETTSTPEPTSTASPGYAIETSPKPTLTPTPTPVVITNAVSVDPDEQEKEVPAECMDKAGNHITDLSAFMRFVIEADKNGNIKVLSGVCKNCGEEKELNISGLKIGFSVGNIGPYQYYYTDSTGASLDGISLRSLRFKKDLEISKDTDLDGASLYVEGKLTVKAKLSNAGDIVCQELLVENGGNVSSAYSITSSKKVELQNGSTVSAGEDIKSDHDISIDGMFTGSRIIGKNITIGKNAHVQLNNCIECKEDLTINREGFYCREVHLGGGLKMADKTHSTIDELILDKPLLKLDYYSKKVEKNYDVEKIDGNINKITYLTFDETDAKYIRDTVFLGLKDWLGNKVTSGNSFYQLYEDLRSLISFLESENGKIDETKLGLALSGNAFTGKSVETVAQEWDAEVGSVLVNSDEKKARSFYNSNGEKIKNAVKYALINDMFIINHTHSMSDADWTISFPKIADIGEQLYSCYGENWIITLDNVMGMDVTITVNDQTKSLPVSVFSGKLVHSGSGASMTWTLAPKNFKQMYSAIMACGCSSIVNQLKKAAKAVVGEWTKLAADVHMFDNNWGATLWKKANEKAESILMRNMNVWQYYRAITIQQVGTTVYEVLGDLQDEMKALNIFVDMYNKVKQLKNNTIDFN